MARLVLALLAVLAFALAGDLFLTDDPCASMLLDHAREGDSSDATRTWWPPGWDCEIRAPDGSLRASGRGSSLLTPLLVAGLAVVLAWQALRRRRA